MVKEKKTNKHPEPSRTKGRGSCSPLVLILFGRKWILMDSAHTHTPPTTSQQTGRYQIKNKTKTRAVSQPTPEASTGLFVRADAETRTRASPPLLCGVKGMNSVLVARAPALAVTHTMRQQLHCRRQMTRSDKRGEVVSRSDVPCCAHPDNSGPPNPATGGGKGEPRCLPGKSWDGFRYVKACSYIQMFLNRVDVLSGLVCLDSISD